MGSNYELLIAKINEFIRKFYLNQLLRGSIYSATAILIGYLCLFLSAYYFNPSVTTKTGLFFSFIILSLFAVGYWIIKPLMSYFKVNQGLSIEQAAHLIGNHFFQVKDRLLNTLQLKALADQSPQNNQLILAGIDQKIGELKPIPFTRAIDLKNNKKYIKYLILPLGIIVCIGIIAPTILREGTDNFIRYNEEILPKAPFQFTINNKTLQVTQGDDLTINLSLTGNEFPQDIYLEDGINTYKLEKENINSFNYTFKNLQKDKSIKFNGGGFHSSTFTISVKPRPSLLNMRAKIVFPAYLNRKPEDINNVGDLLLPEGAKINWQFFTENSETLDFILENKVHALKVNQNVAAFSAVILNGITYQIVPKNNAVSNADALRHQINIIKDQFPTISVEESKDSISTKALYFSGQVTDDYGFSALKFKFNLKQDGKTIRSGSKNISIKNNQIENSFFYLWNLNELSVQPGEVLEYFFEISDNDGVNGPKISKSAVKIYQSPSQQQLAEKLAAGSELLKQKMESTMKLASNIEKESKKISQNLLDKKQLSFEDKKQIEQLLEKQTSLEEAIKEVKKQNEKNAFEKAENNALNEELKEKQKQIDKLFDNVLDEKTKALLQKLQQLMTQNNKDQTREELSKMQLDNKSLKNELDRILELYKQLEFEQNLQNKIDRLEEMAKQQKELSQQSKSKNEPASELKAKQDQLQKDFNALQKELEKLAAQNQELEKPNSFKNPEKEAAQIEKKQQESKEQLQQQNLQKAAEKQQEASEQMQDLAKQMKDMQQEGQEEEAKTNAAELRKLVENLLRTSFEQEKVMLGLRRMSSNDPSYVGQVQQQQGIKDNMKTIADSLFSLSKRVPQIESTVSTEVDKINFNIGKSLELLADRRTSEANRSQQFAMTSINNLALMLNEALEQMQNSKGSSSGKGKKGTKQLQQMQEQLNKNMQNAREKMQREGGNQGAVPKGSMSQEFAKMAQQQQMIREALQKINREENKDGRGGLGNLNQMIQEMKQTELDLVNKKISLETMNRQKNLLTKLLDAEKAQREQDQDTKLESNAAKDFPPSYQQMLEKYNKQLKSNSDLIQKLPPNLNYYYKNKVSTYFKLLNSTP